MQSLSTNATNPVSTCARPVLRATPGPPLRSRRISAAAWSAAISATAWRSVEPSSTTNTGCDVPSADRQWVSMSIRSRTGMITVTSSGASEPGGQGWARPASVNRRASVPSAEVATGPDCSAFQEHGGGPGLVLHGNAVAISAHEAGIGTIPPLTVYVLNSLFQHAHVVRVKRVWPRASTGATVIGPRTADTNRTGQLINHGIAPATADQTFLPPGST
jgi:hypothetical protein